jgi:hypothetical protein
VYFIWTIAVDRKSCRVCAKLAPSRADGHRENIVLSRVLLSAQVAERLRDAPEGVVAKLVTVEAISKLVEVEAPL